MLLLGIISKEIIQKKEKAIYIFIVTIISRNIGNNRYYLVFTISAHMISNSKKTLRKTILSTALNQGNHTQASTSGKWQNQQTLQPRIV